jgi:hypothetical protein
MIKNKINVNLINRKIKNFIDYRSARLRLPPAIHWKCQLQEFQAQYG